MSSVLDAPATVTPPPRGADKNTDADLQGDVPDASEIYRISIDEYQAMIKHGIFDDRETPIELLEGILVKKMSKDFGHILTLQQLKILIDQLLSQPDRTLTQDPILLAESEPEPDLVLLRAEALPLRRKPTPDDIAVVIEVADSSLGRDRRRKLRIYAAANLPVYWIVNLRENVIEVYTDPQPGAKPATYAKRSIHRLGAQVTFELDGRALTLNVADILPPADSAE